MPGENANLELSNEEVLFELDREEEKMNQELSAAFIDLEFLKEEKENIENPDKLGKVILDQVWTQFGNQIGLDLTNETLIQEYDRKHPEEKEYKNVANQVMQDPKYKTENKKMKQKQQDGNLQDAYTGKKIARNESANLDHVVPRKEIFENQRRKQAGLDTASLANKKENLQPTNEALNKSKGAKSNKDYVLERKQREQNLDKQYEKKVQKINESNQSNTEKRLQKEKLKKNLDNKKAADDDLMLDADKKARKAINKEINQKATANVGKKAGKDALKAMAVSGLFSLLQEIMNGLVRFFKSQAKSFKNFLNEMKEAIRSFFKKITSVIQTGVSTVVGTIGSEVLGPIVSEVFKPIVSIFQKMASFIKQGISSFMDAIRFLKDKNNREKPLSYIVAEIGKIVIGALTGGHAIVLSEVIEASLMQFPFFAFEIPLLGSLANIIGLFLGSTICGVIGAIFINLLDRAIARQQRGELSREKVAKGNEILTKQNQILAVNEQKLQIQKATAYDSISNRHQEASVIMSDALNNIFNHEQENYDNQTTLDELDDLLNNF